jgi:phosphoglycolate phosphatase/pyrophosphatase PpaX
MHLRYRCLILDHDDTAVNSSYTIHYPAHLEVMRQLRPQLEPVSFEGWMAKNFDPGVLEYLRDELGMDEEEIQLEYRIWRQYTTTRIPSFFPGFPQLLAEFKQNGGIITVVSHSEKELIERDYRKANHAASLMPDMVFGWDFDKTKRKPSPWPVSRILSSFDLEPQDALIVDDLKPGVVMAKASGVPAVAAGWAHDIPVIRDYMQAHCLHYFSEVSELREYLLGEN